MDLEQVKKVGILAAQKAGEVLRRFHGTELSIRKKGAIDLVTEADTASEKRIIDTILSRYPGHGILAEESGHIPGEGKYRWIIDPLDGTTNFAHGLDLYSVSIAFSVADQVVMGVVFAPASGELFAAVKGKGATLNGKAIRVSSTESLSDSLLVTGFPYNSREMMAPLLTRFSNCLAACQGIRRLGSAAIDLCYVACGRFDGFWEENLKPWDTAAGALIAGEAGARVTDFDDTAFLIDMAQIVASNGCIHSEMLALLGSGNTEKSA